MKDIKNFCKLFDINIPVDEHFDYYINLLEKANNKDYSPLIRQYEEYENTVESAYGDKMRWFDKLIKIISETEAYRIFISYPIHIHKTSHFNKINDLDLENYTLVSIDISKANYQILKGFDDRDKDLGSSWDEFLILNKVPDIYHFSKSFRQHIFGNLNAKRQQTLQSAIIDCVDTVLVEQGLNLPEIVIKSHDEIVFAVPRSGGFDTFFKNAGRINYLYKEKYKKEIDFKTNYYYLEKIGKNKFIKNYIDINPPIEVIAQELLGVEGHLFYMYLKKYILNEEIEYRDTLFYNDKRLAQWIDVEV